jgi:hypothetical protein
MFSMRLRAIRKSLGRIAAVVAESLAAKAAALMQCPAGNGSVDDPHRQARAYALDALQAVSGELSQTPTDYAPLRQTMEGLGPAAAARFVQALNPSGPCNSQIINSKAQDRILAAMNTGPHTQTTGAVVQTIFAQTLPSALHALPSMQQHMAKALAREWYPDNPIKRIAETNRLAGILAVVQGQHLLFGSDDDDSIPLDARVSALAIIRADSSITAATLTKTADPWTSMAIIGPLAQANTRRFLALHGGAPQTLRGTNLDNNAGYIMGFPPAVLPGVSPSELLDRSQHGQSINPIQDPSARGLWLSLAADTAGMAAFASEAALARIASMEGELDFAASWALGSVEVIANATNGAAFAGAGPT